MLSSGKIGKKQGSSTAANQSEPRQDEFDRLTAAISTPRIEKSKKKLIPTGDNEDPYPQELSDIGN